MGILASISMPKKLLLAVGMLVLGIFVLGLSLSSSKGRLSPISYPGRDTEKPFAKLMTNEMVPGNPVYLVLMLRDRIELQLTQDPVKNAKKRIELANARLQTSRVLFDDGDVDLGLSTLSKAEQYLSSAIPLLRQHNLPELSLVESTLLSHRHMIDALKTQLSDADKARIDHVLDLNASLIQSISQH